MDGAKIDAYGEELYRALRERFTVVHEEEGARAFSLRVFDCRERLFDELAATNFLAGKKTRKLDECHRCKFVS